MASLPNEVHFHTVELGEIHPRNRSITATTLPPVTSVGVSSHLPPATSNLPSMILLDRPQSRVNLISSTTSGAASTADDASTSLLLHDNDHTAAAADSKDGVDKGTTPEALCRYWLMKRVRAKAPSGGGAGAPDLTKDLFMHLAKQLTMGEFFSTRLWRLMDSRKVDAVDPELFVKWGTILISPMTPDNQRDKLHLIFRILDRECRDKFSKTDLFEILDGSFHSTFAVIARDESKKMSVTRATVLKAEKKGGDLEIVESLQKQRKAEEAKIQSYVDSVFSRASLSKTQKIIELEFIKFWGYSTINGPSTGVANPPDILAWWLKAINYRGQVCFELMKTRLA